MRCVTSDKSYTAAIAHLKENIDRIEYAWFINSEVLGGSLFLYVTPTGDVLAFESGSGRCGCLTQIKAGECVAMGFKNSEALTEEIRADPNIPTSWGRINEEHLPHFAEWQRRLDKLAEEEGDDSL